MFHWILRAFGFSSEALLSVPAPGFWVRSQLTHRFGLNSIIVSLLIFLRDVCEEQTGLRPRTSSCATPRRVLTCVYSLEDIVNLTHAWFHIKALTTQLLLIQLYIGLYRYINIYLYVPFTWSIQYSENVLIDIWLALRRFKQGEMSHHSDSHL